MSTVHLKVRCFQFPESGSRTPSFSSKIVFDGLTGLLEL